MLPSRVYKRQRQPGTDVVPAPLNNAYSYQLLRTNPATHRPTLHYTSIEDGRRRETHTSQSLTLPWTSHMMCRDDRWLSFCLCRSSSTYKNRKSTKLPEQRRCHLSESRHVGHRNHFDVWYKPRRDGLRHRRCEGLT